MVTAVGMTSSHEVDFCLGFPALPANLVSLNASFLAVAVRGGFTLWF